MFWNIRGQTSCKHFSVGKQYRVFLLSSLLFSVHLLQVYSLLFVSRNQNLLFLIQMQILSSSAHCIDLKLQIGSGQISGCLFQGPHFHSLLFEQDMKKFSTLLKELKDGSEVIFMSQLYLVWQRYSIYMIFAFQEKWKMHLTIQFSHCLPRVTYRPFSIENRS